MQYSPVEDAELHRERSLAGTSGRHLAMVPADIVKSAVLIMLPVAAHKQHYPNRREDHQAHRDYEPYPQRDMGQESTEEQ